MAGLFSFSALAQSIAATDPSALVDTQKAAGKVFRGASVPFGMMMWGPHSEGYSLTYLSGASMPRQFDNQVPILPLPTSALSGGLFDSKDGHPSRGASVDAGEPGYFRSELASGSSIELSATARAGLSRIRFADRAPGSVLFYLYNEQSSAEIVSSTELRGWTTRGNVRFYFFARFSRPFTTHGFWKGSALQPGVGQADGSNGVYVSFDSAPDDSVMLKLGISFTRPENARANLDAEIPGWDLEAVRHAASSLWARKLSRIEIDGGTDEERRAFYTNFYHMHLGPSVFNDVNGEYMGFDDRIHPAGDHVQYANFSGWDIYRSWVQLMSWLDPTELSDMMQSLVNDAVQAGGGMPRWPVANRETGVMDPGSATPIVANAFAFGARGFDTEAAYGILESSETDASQHCQPAFDVHEGLSDYLRLGYVPYSRENDWRKQAASLTLEYALGDFALSRLASALGRDDRASQFARMSDNWRKLWDPRRKLIVPRTESGRWTWPFFSTIGARHGFTEGDSVQYSWMVPQNLRGLIDAMGGDAAAVRRLDHQTTRLRTDEYGSHVDLSNEPSFGIPWVYNWAHQPWKTQAVVRRAVRELFLDKLPGDDDLGETSSWSIWAMLGLYPEIPGVAGLTIGSPIFPRAVLHRGDGNDLTLVASGAAADAPYVQDLAVNGRGWDRAWLELSDIAGASELDFTLGTQPARDWAARAGAEPPSF
jgi:predicted alpha-1,2-mannosidase